MDYEETKYTINYWYDNGEFNDIKEANWVMT